MMTVTVTVDDVTDVIDMINVTDATDATDVMKIVIVVMHWTVMHVMMTVTASVTVIATETDVADATNVIVVVAIVEQIPDSELLSQDMGVTLHELTTLVMSTQIKQSSFVLKIL